MGEVSGADSSLRPAHSSSESCVVAILASVGGRWRPSSWRFRSRTDYRLVLRRRIVHDERLSYEQAVMAAFEENAHDLARAVKVSAACG